MLLYLIPLFDSLIDVAHHLVHISKRASMNKSAYSKKIAALNRSIIRLKAKEAKAAAATEAKADEAKYDDETLRSFEKFDGQFELYKIGMKLLSWPKRQVLRNQSNPNVAITKADYAAFVSMMDFMADMAEKKKNIKIPSVALDHFERFKMWVEIQDIDTSGPAD